MCTRRQMCAGDEWQQRWARDGQVSKQQQCDVVVKREKPKTHEARRLVLGDTEHQESERAAVQACTAT